MRSSPGSTRCSPRSSSTASSACTTSKHRVEPARHAEDVPRLHRSLTWAMKILDVPEPEMYVTVDPVPNAWTYGHTKPFITLTTGLIDMLSDEELFFVIGHEVGHIKAGHVLYGTMARNIAAVVALIGQATLASARSSGRASWSRCTSGIARRAHGGSRRAAVRAGSRTGARHVHEARRRHDATRGGDRSRRVLPPGPRSTRTSTARRSTRPYKVLLAQLPRTHPFAMQRLAKELEDVVRRGIFPRSSPAPLIAATGLTLAA